MVRDTVADGLVATVKRLSSRPTPQPDAQASPEPAPHAQVHRRRHGSVGNQTEATRANSSSSSLCAGHLSKSTTPPGSTTTAATRSKHVQALPSTIQPTQTHPLALQNRQVPPPASAPFTAGTNIQDPSLGILPPSATNSTSTPLETPASSAYSSPIPTAVIVTIALGTIAGVVVVSLAAVVIHMRIRRRRRRGRGQPSSQSLESDKKAVSANASSTVLNSPGLASLFPDLTTTTTITPPPSPPSPPSPSTVLRNDNAGGRGNDVRLEDLRARAKPGERKFHQITRSDGFIHVRPSRNSHTRWGKPSSLGNIPSAGDMPSRYTGDAQPPGRASPHSRAPSRNQYSIFPPRTTPPALKAHKPAASTSTTSTLRDNGASPPRTPKAGVFGQVNGLVSPGPPPARALPCPPLKYWQVNPLSPPLDTQMDHVRPEEIGIAIGSPTTEETREKRPRLDESDMERLGGTYSPFKR
ncbi:hypothetical protein NOR_05439 [Metarhizium rileyi]|uniref:Uncharacterized protein n=1 Tax=Metarhizium rileyi (strain RCEF 4871) TaxID=1649241 RepID=A0A167CMJ5_METRR|nr:hypothetical protein NOR_05439 [Metarhizium rileyi RCEF 4871]